MKRVLIVGGANGIGLAIATELAKRPLTEKVIIVDKSPVKENLLLSAFECHLFDLTSSDYSFFERFTDIDSLIITAGFGRLSLFKDVPEAYISDSFNVNTIPAMRLIKRFYDRISGKEKFYCCVMVSISAYLSSPFYAVYAATKAALRLFIESVNVELEKSGSVNKILNVSPGYIPGTSFNGAETDLEQIKEMSFEVIDHLENGDDLFIPKYEEVFKDVLERAYRDFREEGRKSFEYKLESINGRR